MFIMSIIIISDLSILSPCSESGGGYASIDDYARIHYRTDASPLQCSTTFSIYNISHPMRTPAMQYCDAIYDHF